MRPSETVSKTGRPYSLFYKLVFPREFKEKKMRIPPKFVRYYRNELCDAATIVVPTGRVWPIGLSEKNKDIFFDMGCPRFLEHYSITEGQFLIFKYEGDSRFNVRICDTSCCEIRYPPDEINNNEGPSRQRGEPSHRSTPVETANLPTPCAFSSPLLNNSDLRRNETRTSTKGKGKVRTDVGETEFTEVEEEETWETEFMELDEEETGCGEQCANTFTNRVGSQSVEIVDLDSSDGSETHEASNTTRRRLYEAKRKVKVCFGIQRQRLNSASPASRRAIQETEKIEADNPCFRTLLSTDNMKKHQMYVPLKFARRYLSRVGHLERIVIHGSCGRKWVFRFYHLKYGGDLHYSLTAGFQGFFEDNMLEAGDVLHFELVDSENPGLKVHIFHAQDFAG
ncbi:hypothetical protein Tsubulata_036572 [Turnera subulata]|uniref:TF-B3 domain-containing protein n=1 Tax=Turnera subulata TaxID=218843 RepID=A0A9Q0F8H0_9ROSI|nr:hypothetical protein Tsubulata_036572 [Turnera subulata]